MKSIKLGSSKNVVKMLLVKVGNKYGKTIRAVLVFSWFKFFSKNGSIVTF